MLVLEKTTLTIDIIQDYKKIPGMKPRVHKPVANSGLA